MNLQCATTGISPPTCVFLKSKFNFKLTLQNKNEGAKKDLLMIKATVASTASKVHQRFTKSNLRILPSKQ